MVQHIASLNLARKWRSKSFNTVIGQDLVVRILKNSLYKGQFFPVYLFAGQRGCGKTTTARIFAAAVNCELLDQFQQQPQTTVLPCQQCTSCRAMTLYQHPDFIEIDAASHTGVDNVRAITDAAGLLPILGRKKIYLIDEAHMLSKAACNAFLKMLEEPPQSVIFILATTDPQKIIETVRSRCFTLLFGSIEHSVLVSHLETVCKAEQIPYEVAGLNTIVQHTQGCVRDAINLLEQVRFGHPVVTAQAVKQLLGHVDDDAIILLLQAAITQPPMHIIRAIQALQQQQVTPNYLWNGLISLMRELLWMKLNIALSRFEPFSKQLESLAKRLSVSHITTIMEQFFAYEEQFKRSISPYALLEFILLRLRSQSGPENGGVASAALSIASEDEVFIDEDEDEEYEDEEDDIEEEEEEAAEILEVTPPTHGMWQQIMHELARKDPFSHSMLSQATVREKDGIIVELELPTTLALFKDTLDALHAPWKVIYSKFSNTAVLPRVSFSGNLVIKQIEQVPYSKSISTKQVTAKSTVDTSIQNKSHLTSTRNSLFTRKNSVSGRLFTVSAHDPAWQKTNLILSFFPGTLMRMPS